MSTQFTRASEVVDAIQLRQNNTNLFIQWVEDHGGSTAYQCRNMTGTGECIPEAGHNTFIRTEAGLTVVGITDWAVFERGEWVVMKNDKFCSRYEGDYDVEAPIPGDPHSPPIDPENPHVPEPPVQEEVAVEEDIPVDPIYPSIPGDYVPATPENPDDIPDYKLDEDGNLVPVITEEGEV